MHSFKQFTPVYDEFTLCHETLRASVGTKFVQM